ncbi:MAG: hypothetical protein ACC645_04040 [Pirellulales bacterium]
MINRCDRLVGTRYMSLALALASLVPATGCHQVVATAVFLWKGTGVPAEYTGLEGKRVVVVCRPPSSLEYRDASASRDLAKRIGGLLATNVKGIDVVNPRDVEEWTDENNADDFQDLGDTLNADLVLHVELDEFTLYKERSRSLYQGNADGTITVYDLRKGGSLAWEKPLGQILFPVNSAVPVQEKTLPHFRRQFINVLAEEIAISFYAHNPNDDFAMDATAHR